jgi:beta-galactosidase
MEALFGLTKPFMAPGLVVLRMTSHLSSFSLPSVEARASYVLTIIIDVMGRDEEWRKAPLRQVKNPRGILDYNLSGHYQDDISWKLTGNLGGEDYIDIARGPLKE